MTARDDARKAEFERWQREVCAPADAAAEPREFRTRAGETATWQLAPIPSGWASRYSAWKADGTGGAAPWRAFPTREEAQASALASIVRILSFHEGSKLLELIPSPDQDGLF